MYAMVCGALIKFRIKKSDQYDNYYKIPYGIIFAITGILFSLWLFSSSQLVEIRDVLICIASGILIFWIYKKISSTTVR